MGYPTDLSDSDWTKIAHILEPKHSHGFTAKYSKRDQFNAILYINKTGCQWRFLPNDFPPWNSVYKFFVKLLRRGVFKLISHVLTIMLRVSAGRNIDPSLACIDSQSVKGDVNLEQKGIDGNKKVNGRKRHIMTDVMGLILGCIVTPANEHDLEPGKRLLEKAAFTSDLVKVLVDQAYKKLELPNKNIKVEIASKPPSSKGFVPIHKRWVVERTFAWLARQRRLAKEYEYKVEHQVAMVYIGMIKIMLNKLS